MKNVDVFMDEYTRGDTIAKYVSRTAGAGIEYVLTNVYAPVYLRVIRQIMAIRPKAYRYRLLEYGCGGGMNLLELIEVLRSAGAELERGYGADFSVPMVEAARKEAAEHLPEELVSKLSYVVAANETLMDDLSSGLALSSTQLSNSFDLIVGVNTTRYCHRLKKENHCAKDIFDMLRPGGYSIMIDMNRYFPLFRSKLRNIFKPEREVYLPSLSEYTQPFRKAGFRIEESRNFCWVPHSAKPGLLAVCKTLSPVLDVCFSPFAMRSLVVAQKPR